MENWKQFTLYPPGCRNKFQPLQILHTFLPQWLAKSPEIVIWHVLFEPSALIRFVAGNPTKVLQRAETLAGICGLELVRGDTSSDLNPGVAYPEEDYHGEAEYYGEELWKANCDFMQACGNLSIVLQKLPHDKQVFMFRKFVHLYANILGMNFLEEAGFAEHWKERALELYKSHGRS